MSHLMTCGLLLSHYTTLAPCWAQDLARGLNSSRSSWVHGFGRLVQTSRCFIVCSPPHSHVVCNQTHLYYYTSRLQMSIHKICPFLAVRAKFDSDHRQNASLSSHSYSHESVICLYFLD